MGIKLTTPVPIEVAQNVALTHFRVLVPHEMTPSGDIKIVKKEVKIVANFVTFSTDGDSIEEQAMPIPLKDVPNQGIELIKQIYEWLEQEGQRQGRVGDGTPEPLEKEETP